MPEIIGRWTCPICGERAQDVKANKNRKIYSFCDNGCKAQLGAKQSRAVLASLSAGKSIAIEKIGVISPVQTVKTDSAESKKSFWNNDEDEF